MVVNVPDEIYSETIGAFRKRKEVGFVLIGERYTSSGRVAEHFVVGCLLAKQKRSRGALSIDVAEKRMKTIAGRVVADAILAFPLVGTEIENTKHSCKTV